ncbi:hypothetical protein LXL04_004045 [Taraxacum kok-saghyz]
MKDAEKYTTIEKKEHHKEMRRLQLAIPSITSSGVVLEKAKKLHPFPPSKIFKVVADLGVIFGNYVFWRPMFGSPSTTSSSSLMEYRERERERERTVQMGTIIEFENARTNLGHLFFMLKKIIYNHI